MGSSSVKAALIDIDTGKCDSTAAFPEKQAIAKVKSQHDVHADEIMLIGISYQMHGLVCMVADVIPTFGFSIRFTSKTAEDLGLKTGIPISYRAGDQPNNVLSLNVFNPGEIASIAGTSGGYRSIPH